MKSISFPVRIYLIALILRLVPVLLTRGLAIGLDDMFQYDMLARSLASGNGFRWYARADLNILSQFVDFDLDKIQDYDPIRGIATSFRAPLYPAFLAAVYFLTGTGESRFFVARLVQVIILSAPLAPLTYLVGRRLLPEKESTARMASAIVASYPILILYPLGLGTENLFFILLLSAFLCLIQLVDRNSLGSCILAGALLALTCLTRSVILPFAALALIWTWFKVSRNGTLAVFLIMSALILPWVIRNSLLHGKISGIESSMGYNLYLGYHPQGDGSFVFGPSLDLLTIVDDAERDRVGMQNATEFISDQPGRFIPLAVKRLGFFFGLEKRVLMYFYSNNLVGHLPSLPLLLIFLVLAIPFVIISLSAVMGFFIMRPGGPKITLLVLLFVAYLLPHVFILSEDRFHLALVPFLAIFAGVFWTDGIKLVKIAWKGSRSAKQSLLAGVSICALLIFNWSMELLRDAPKLAALFGPNGNHTYFPY